MKYQAGNDLAWQLLFQATNEAAAEMQSQRGAIQYAPNIVFSRRDILFHHWAGNVLFIKAGHTEVCAVMCYPRSLQQIVLTALSVLGGSPVVTNQKLKYYKTGSRMLFKLQLIFLHNNNEKPNNIVETVKVKNKTWAGINAESLLVKYKQLT